MERIGNGYAESEGECVGAGMTRAMGRRRERERDKGLGFLKFWNLQLKRYGGCSGD